MGGSSQPKNTTSTTTTQLDPAMRAMLQQTFNRAQTVADQPYQAYGGQAIAPLNDYQMAGIGYGANAALNNTGGQAVQSGINSAMNAGNYSPQQVQAGSVGASAMYNPASVGTGAWDANAAAQYMSPYTQNVIDSTNAQIDRNTAQTTNATNAAAVNAGAFGGTRQAVQSAENQRSADQIKAQTAASLNNQAYSNAQGMFTNDQQRQLAAAQGNQSAGLQAGLSYNQQALQAGMANQSAGLQAGMANQSAGLQAANLGLGSADLLGRLGLSQSQMAQGNAGALLGYGGVMQGQQQQENDYRLGQFQEQRDWGLRGLGALQGAVSGAPSGSSTAATTPLYKNKTAGALGGAASGAAMGSAFGPWGTAIGAVGGGLMGMFG